MSTDTLNRAIQAAYNAEYPPPPPPFVAYDADFSCNLVASVQECGFGVQCQLGQGRATLLPIGRNGGRTGVRLHVEPTDTNVFGSGPTNTRCDLTLPQSITFGYAGQEQWWAHSTRFPSDWVDPLPSVPGGAWNWAAIFGFHASGDVPGTLGTLSLNVMPATQPDKTWPTGIHLVGYVAAAPLPQPTVAAYDVALGPVVRGIWYDFVYHVKWDYAAGFIEAWMNGKHILGYSGRTLYDGQGVYLKPALYGSVTPARSIELDRIRRGSTWKSVATGPLEGL